MNVQAIERTLIDKIFAVCDYYESGRIHQNSRHLYDIHKIFSNYTFDRETFLELLYNVAADRSVKQTLNVSSQKGYTLTHTLEQIILKKIYEKDYDEITNSLLFSDGSYNDAIMSLTQIIESGLLPDKIGQSL